MSNATDPKADPSAPQERPSTLNRRFDFGSYTEMRYFLDHLADLSKREEYYPNVSFGKTYVNVSIDGEGQAVLSERKSIFLSEMDALATVDKA